MSKQQSPETTILELLRHIVLDALAAHTVEEQVERVVSGVRDAMKVDVCSLYLGVGTKLRLIASAGSASGKVGRIELESGEGLVGTIAATQMPLNLAAASEHPMYHHLPESEGEAFEAFLGVPVVNLGQTIGVLVVQKRGQRPFSSAEETLLITISAQLAGNLLRWPEAERGSDPNPRKNRQVRGIKGSVGVAIGNVHIVGGDLTLQLIQSAPTTDVETESAYLAAAVAEIHAELDRARVQLKGSVPEEVLAVFDFYKLMLESDELIAAVKKRIVDGTSAFTAVRDTVSEVALTFEGMTDSYLRARGEDIHHIGNKLMGAILGHGGIAPGTGADIVLVADLVSITDIAVFRRDQLAGIICLRGSGLSHTAVLANALGLPAVMGVGPIADVKDGELAVVDGGHGVVVFNPDRVLVREYQQLIEQERALQRDLLANKALPAVTPDGFRVRLYANTGLVSDVRPGLDHGAEGIGLYRSEIPFLSQSRFPTENEQYEIYRDIIAAYYPLPVTMRTLDIGGDKPLPYLPFEEENPSLGWRGIRFALDNRPVFVTQLRAMLRANAGFGTMKLMLPMVGNIEDVLQVIPLLTQVFDELVLEGVPVTTPALGVMVEVPGVVQLISALAPHIQFISIGTNDLAQYLLAVDRTNPRVSMRYDSLHPAVLHTIWGVVRKAATLKLEVSLCGEMAADPVAATLLLGMGIETLSMSAFHIPRIKELIRKLPRRVARRLLNQALRMDNPRAIRDLARDALCSQDLSYLLT